MSYTRERQQIIYWAQALNRKGLVSARSGNISCKLPDNKILMTSHDCYLGFLEEKDILLTDSKGDILEGKGELTSEKELHLNIYKRFKDVKVILHTHSPYTVAFFHYFDKLDIFSFETRFYLGDVKVIPQETPIVTDLEPVISCFGDSNIAVLKNHGVVSTGRDFKEAFSLIELLEEQARVNLMAGRGHRVTAPPGHKGICTRKYKLLSPEHIQRLVELVNNDEQAQRLGREYDLTCSLAVKNQDTQEAACFYYEKGRIINSDNNENAEFVIIGRGEILKKVFNREIDPFVAVTQGRVETKGNFSKMSRWYPVMVKTFELWRQAPVD